MNSKHSKILLKLINEEIDSYLLEQDPSAASTPPADPNAPPPSPEENMGGDKEEENPEEKAKKKIEELSKLSSDDDMLKTIKAGLQGSEKQEMKDVLGYIEKNKNEKTPDKMIPQNVLKVVEKFQKDFDLKPFPPPQEKPVTPNVSATPQATPPASPVTESRLQKLAKEYLHYKKLYLRSK